MLVFNSSVQKAVICKQSGSGVLDCIKGSLTVPKREGSLGLYLGVPLIGQLQRMICTFYCHLLFSVGQEGLYPLQGLVAYPIVL